MAQSPSNGIQLSILVPTYGRPDLLEQLLGCLERQTLDPACFEVIIVDDGSPEPVAVDASARAFAVQLIRQDNAGPAAARNTGLAHCRAPLTLILNDDALPAPDLLAKHLEIHAEVGDKVAVLGTFHFNQRSLQSPFTQILAATDLLFDFPRLRHGELHNWTYFWTCNLSLSTSDLRAVGGFDAERFHKAIVEDVELGYRLEQVGYRVLYREDARCEHDHALTPTGYFARAVNLGIYLARMYRKHRDPAILWCGPGEDIDLKHMSATQSTCEAFHAQVGKLISALESFEQKNQGLRVDPDQIAQLSVMIRRLSYVPFCRGVLQELEGSEPYEVLENGPATGELTSVVVVSHDALDQTRRCLAALRAARDERFRTELIFVDNGSTDGTAEFLAEQADVRLIRNAQNLGAPRARNQGIRVANGAFVAFMDNDVMVSPGWLPRMMYHLQVDSCSGSVSCLSDRAAHHQQIEFTENYTPATLQAFADRRANDYERQYRPQTLLTSFMLMVRREVIDAIGGFDETFSPWGFEDDDFSLRTHLAGFRNRVALDVFVRHEPYTSTRKQKAHLGLLQRNWARFAKKWSLPAGTPYGECGELRDSAPGSVPVEQLHLPLEGQERAGDSVLAWPDYSDLDAVRSLIRECVDELAADETRRLVLRVSPKHDGRPEAIAKLVEATYREVCAQDRALGVQYITDKNPKHAAERALQLCAAIKPSGNSERRAKWLDQTGLPQVTA